MGWIRRGFHVLTLYGWMIMIANRTKIHANISFEQHKKIEDDIKFRFIQGLLISMRKEIPWGFGHDLHLRNGTFLLYDIPDTVTQKCCVKGELQDILVLELPSGITNKTDLRKFIYLSGIFGCDNITPNSILPKTEYSTPEQLFQFHIERAIVYGTMSREYATAIESTMNMLS
jgi:hypothetical protein